MKEDILEQNISVQEVVCPDCNGTHLIKRGIRNGSQRFKCSECNRWFFVPLDELVEGSLAMKNDIEIINENVRLAKQKQRFQDSNRIERKSFREFARVDNALIEYSKNIIDLLEGLHLEKFTKKHKIGKRSGVGVLHITDAHFNELVDLPENSYDFNVASKRLKKFVDESKKYFNTHKIDKVLVAMTGDLLNSDRRLDELLNQSTNRAKASLLASFLLEQVLIDLNRDYDVSVACVSGNESRIKEDWDYSEVLVSDNYDFSIFNILRIMFRKADGINFVIGDPGELLIDVNEQKWVLIHGNSLSKNTEKEVQGIFGKYAAQGILLDFVIFGHLHHFEGGDFFARGASIVGSNAYSNKGLNLASRASQNIYIVFNKKDRHIINIDLQDVSGVTGYDIKEQLVSYNTKSASKVSKPRTIFKVVI